MNKNKKTNQETKQVNELLEVGMPPIETFMNIPAKLRKEHLFNVIIIRLF
jgi:hypothetical protein